MDLTNLEHHYFPEYYHQMFLNYSEKSLFFINKIIIIIKNSTFLEMFFYLI